MIKLLEPWTQLRDVIVLLTPVFVFSFLSSIAIYLLFVLFIPFITRFGRPQMGLAPSVQTQQQAAPSIDDDDFGYAGSFSYLFLASLFGLVLGMLVKLVGGFSALEKSSPNTLVGAIGTVLVIVLGVVGTLFAETGHINLRRPLGAIAFLLSFLVSGFYWKLLETAVH